jgi:formate hydrogenlyase subunit 4
MLAVLANVVAMLVMPIALLGVINRVKARWSGRKGAPIFQLAFDLRRLLAKASVHSATTTPIFRVAPYVVLVTAIGSACLTPLVGLRPIAPFAFDFVWFAYVWGLGRVALMLGALDTGSSFEGMGAAREATFSAVVEPVLFLVAGALCLTTGAHSFHEILALQVDGGTTIAVEVGAVVAIAIVLQVESARIPIDDPTTHLELTMIHEVMILDHSGPGLAMLQLGSAIKLFVATSVLAALLNPWAGAGGVIGPVVHVVLCLAIAVALGLSESLVARLKLRVVPQYIVVALIASAFALLAVLGGSVT